MSTKEFNKCPFCYLCYAICVAVGSVVGSHELAGIDQSTSSSMDLSGLVNQTLLVAKAKNTPVCMKILVQLRSIAYTTEILYFVLS